jgi:hypothetical protein
MALLSLGLPGAHDRDDLLDGRRIGRISPGAAYTTSDDLTLRSVRRRTLISVLAWDRSINFCNPADP